MAFFLYLSSNLLEQGLDPDIFWGHGLLSVATEVILQARAFASARVHVMAHY